MSVERFPDSDSLDAEIDLAGSADTAANTTVGIPTAPTAPTSSSSTEEEEMLNTDDSANIEPDTETVAGLMAALANNINEPTSDFITRIAAHFGDGIASLVADRLARLGRRTGNPAERLVASLVGEAAQGAVEHATSPAAG